MGALRTKLDELDATLGQAITKVNAEIAQLEGEIKTLSQGIFAQLESLRPEVDGAKAEIFAKAKALEDKVYGLVE